MHLIRMHLKPPQNIKILVLLTFCLGINQGDTTQKLSYPRWVTEFFFFASVKVMGVNLKSFAL